MSDEEGVLRTPGGQLLPGTANPALVKARSKAVLLSVRIRKMLEEKFAGGDLLPYEVAAEILTNTEESSQDRLKAASFLAERLHGKPTQAIELTGKRGGPVKAEVKDTTPEKPQSERISEALRSLSVLARQSQLPGAGGVGGGTGEDASGAGGGPRSA